MLRTTTQNDSFRRNSAGEVEYDLQKSISRRASIQLRTTARRPLVCAKLIGAAFRFFTYSRTEESKPKDAQVPFSALQSSTFLNTNIMQIPTPTSLIFVLVLCYKLHKWSYCQNQRELIKPQLRLLPIHYRTCLEDRPTENRTYPSQISIATHMLVTMAL